MLHSTDRQVVHSSGRQVVQSTGRFGNRNVFVEVLAFFKITWNVSSPEAGKNIKSDTISQCFLADRIIRVLKGRSHRGRKELQTSC